MATLGVWRNDEAGDFSKRNGSRAATQCESSHAQLGNAVTPPVELSQAITHTDWFGMNFLWTRNVWWTVSDLALASS